MAQHLKSNPTSDFGPFDFKGSPYAAPFLSCQSPFLKALLFAQPNPRLETGFRAFRSGARMQNTSLYESVTNRITAALEQGVVPWKKPWDTTNSLPVNAITQKPYRGVNTFLLGLSPYTDHRWLTFRQAQELGGHVRKGEQSSQIVFWKSFEMEEDEEGNRSRRPPLLCSYLVFNAEQCEGLNLPELPKRRNIGEDERTAKAEVLVASMPDPPEIQRTGTKAYYVPSQDLVRVPPIYRFRSANHFYATLFHELSHSTGHATRLNRKGVTETVNFGSEVYSQEELVAELGSAFCCALLGLDNSLIEDSASYIASWLEVLKHDTKLLIYAASQAQKAADYIRGVTYG